MKTTNRLVALLLALVMIISCAPLSIFAEDTATEGTPDPVKPVADAYLSAQYPDTPTGDLNFLRVNGGEHENIILLSFKTSDFVGKQIKTLLLPATNDAEVYVDLLLINDTFDEMTVTYNNFIEKLDEATPLADDAILRQNGGISLPYGTDLGSMATGEYFTLAVRADSEKEADVWNYESMLKVMTTSTAITLTTTANHVESTVEGEEGNKYAYAHIDNSTNQDLRFFGNVGTTKTSTRFKNGDNYKENYIFVTNMKPIMIYNALGNSDDMVNKVGKTYRFKAHVYTNTDTSRNLSVGVAPSYSATYSTKYAETTPVASGADANNRKDLYIDYTVLAEHVKAPVEVDGVTYYTYPAFFARSSGSGHLGEHSVVELTDGVRERQAVIMAASVSSDRTVIGEPASCEFLPDDPTALLADTYVSAQYPDMAFDNSDRLLLNGGKNENIIFLTYSAQVLDSDKPKLELRLPVENDAYVNAKIFLLDGYYPGENTLTWNTMPELTEDTSVGTYTLTGGLNKVDISACKDKVLGDFFTIAIKSLDNPSYVWNQGFDEYDDHSVKMQLAYRNEVRDEELGKTWAYQFDNTGNDFIAINGGNINTSAAITTVDGNKVFRTGLLGEKATAGRARFYNSFGDSVITKTVDEDGNSLIEMGGYNITGKTYRFKASVKLVDSESEGLTAIVQAVLTRGTAGVEDGKRATLTADWQELTVDYTVNPDHIAVDSTSSGVTYINFPLFGVELKDLADGKAYVDNLNTVELVKVEGEMKEMQALIASSEAEGKVEIVGKGIAPIADTYVSAAEPDKAFGLENKLVLGVGTNESIALITYATDNKNEPLTLTLPTVSASTEVEVLVLDGYIVNEETLTYNNMPDLSTAKSLGKYTLDKSKATTIKLGFIEDISSSSVFTVVIKAIDIDFGPQVIYSQDLESVVLPASGELQLSNSANTATVGGALHAYPYLAEGVDPNGASAIIQVNGSSGNRYVVKDPYNADNQVIKILTYKKKGTGNIKFQNSMGTELLPNANYPAGTKLQFTMRIMLTDSKISGDAVVGYPYGAGSPNPSTNGTKQTIDSSKVNEWQDISIIYTVPETVETARVTNSGNTYTSYPSFAIRITDSDTDETAEPQQYTYYIDDMKTVVLSSASDISFGSRESGEYAYVFGTANAIDGNVVAIEATASAESEGDVISIVDGETYSLVKAENGKLMFGDIVLCNDKGEEIVLGAEATKVVAIYDDVNGKVRFAINGGFACDETGAIIYAKVFNYGVSEDATVNEGVNFSIIKRTPEIVGYQTKDTQYAVRFIAGVDSLYYSNIGFEVNKVGGSMKEVANPGVCLSVNADDVKAEATDYGYNYMSLLSIIEIADNTTDAEVTVRPYFLIGDAKIYGEAVTYTISIVNNAVVVE